ncbi:helix-turn-helix domain-containing protein [Nissabacter sp. SGAir0207]|uniref:helix-turn-helix domain-containing protein n=1 Tax=Nissabacter sp. SGAir0207 TaxID=2126321 RepID=UPI0010CD1B24|nr:helix-turn-helix domain-containing protein [Nissabacter sp. SGAir0207]QCR35685.1 AraC family transcriptional regulator [Nissabacter sp. SGAir0207]
MLTLQIEDYFPRPTDKLAVYASDPENNNHEHCHAFDELVMVERGHGLHVINGKPHFIQEGDIFFVRGRDCHFYDELGTLKITNVLINPTRPFSYLTNTEGLLARFDAAAGGNYGWLMPERHAQCRDLVARLQQPAPSGAPEQAQAIRESLFFQLLMNMVAGSDGPKNHTKYKLHRLLGHVQEHCFEEIAWGEVAERFHLTQRTIYRQIKETTGLTPEAYLKRLRLVSARVKIRETEMPITDIAFLCGFSNSSHFTSSYKRLFGVTPSQERIAPRCPVLPLAG